MLVPPTEENEFTLTDFLTEIELFPLPNDVDDGCHLTSSSSPSSSSSIFGRIFPMIEVNYTVVNESLMTACFTSL